MMYISYKSNTMKLSLISRLDKIFIREIAVFKECVKMGFAISTGSLLFCNYFKLWQRNEVNAS